jgi:hypothetical protein
VRNILKKAFPLPGIETAPFTSMVSNLKVILFLLLEKLRNNYLIKTFDEGIDIYKIDETQT